jgi:hypothetical protein
MHYQTKTLLNFAFYLQIWASEALPHYFSNRQPLVSRLWLWRMMLLCADSDSKLKEVVEVRVIWRA